MKSIGVIVLVLSLESIPVLAHHSFAAEYDSKKPVELKGALISLEWVNPHAWIHIEVKDETGKATKWDRELGSPNLLLRYGWRKDSIKPGDVIIVNGTAAKDGSNIANARTVKFADGTRVFNAGSSGDPGAPGLLRNRFLFVGRGLGHMNYRRPFGHATVCSFSTGARPLYRKRCTRAPV